MRRRGMPVVQGLVETGVPAAGIRKKGPNLPGNQFLKL